MKFKVDKQYPTDLCRNSGARNFFASLNEFSDKQNIKDEVSINNSYFDPDNSVQFIEIQQTKNPSANIQ